MKTQCCQPVEGSVRCTDCPLTYPMYSPKLVYPAKLVPPHRVGPSSNTMKPPHRRKSA